MTRTFPPSPVSPPLPPSSPCAVLRAHPSSFSGGYDGEATPVPIPNTVVKLPRADDTWLVTARQNRSPPDSSGPSGVSPVALFHAVHWAIGRRPGGLVPCRATSQRAKARWRCILSIPADFPTECYNEFHRKRTSSDTCRNTFLNGRPQHAQAGRSPHEHEDPCRR